MSSSHNIQHQSSSSASDDTGYDPRRRQQLASLWAAIYSSGSAPSHHTLPIVPEMTGRSRINATGNTVTQVRIHELLQSTILQQAGKRVQVGTFSVLEQGDRTGIAAPQHGDASFGAGTQPPPRHQPHGPTAFAAAACASRRNDHIVRSNSGVPPATERADAPSTEALNRVVIQPYDADTKPPPGHHQPESHGPTAFAAGTCASRRNDLIMRSNSGVLPDASERTAAPSTCALNRVVIQPYDADTKPPPGHHQPERHGPTAFAAATCASRRNDLIMRSNSGVLPPASEQTAAPSTCALNTVDIQPYDADTRPSPGQHQLERHGPTASAPATCATRRNDRIMRSTSAVHPADKRAAIPSISALNRDVVQPYDVVFGRGKIHPYHPGNVRMRLLADIHRKRYMQADRDDKTRILRSIVNIIKSSGEKGGRFLKLQANGKCWEEVSDVVACRKVGHALRDGQTRPITPIDPTELKEILPLLSDPFKLAALQMGSLSNLYRSLAKEETEMLIDMFARRKPSPPAPNEGDEMETGRDPNKTKKQMPMPSPPVAHVSDRPIFTEELGSVLAPENDSAPS